jgi:sugar lactone lactonase YvrE
MKFPNGLASYRNTLLVADSEGVIYSISSTGIPTVWSNDPLLAPRSFDPNAPSACAGLVPLHIGANGIAIEGRNAYVTNTNYGRLIRIPITLDGSAGTASVVREDCANLEGADGLAIDSNDGSFIIAVNIQNKIVRVSPNGSRVTTLASGSPLSTPASLVIDDSRDGNGRRLLITNSTFFGMPGDTSGLLELPL